MSTSIHVTSGTERRPAHMLSGQGLVFSLADEVEELRQDLRRATGGRAAKTLAKASNLRVTLVLLAEGYALEPEATTGEATVQVLEGRLRVQVDGRSLEVTPGEVVVLVENLHEPVRAVTEAAFLVTIAWPQGAGAWDQEASSGHL